MPTDDDVLKARLKTVGVSEYKFEMEVSAGRDSGTEWRIVDVGGSRSQRRSCPLIVCALKSYAFYQQHGPLSLTMVRHSIFSFKKAHIFTFYIYVYFNQWTPSSSLPQYQGLTKFLARIKLSTAWFVIYLPEAFPLIFDVGGFCLALESCLFFKAAGKR